MIYLFRALVVFCIIYLNYLFGSGFGAGMEPVWIVVLLISIGLSIKKVHHFFFDQKWFKILFVLVILVVMFVEGMILKAAFTDHRDEAYDYIIVLGAGVQGDRISLTLKYRLDVAYDYLVKHDETIAVLSGGQGEGENLTEALAMEKYLVDKGIDRRRLIQEDQSTSTRENIANSYKIFEELGQPNPEVLIVSSRFHLLRAIRIAKELGYTVDGMGSKTLLYLIPNYYFREMFAVIVEYLR